MKIVLHGEIHCIDLRRLYIRLCTQTSMSLDVIQKLCSSQGYKQVYELYPP